MERNDDLRSAVEAADATGMVANEELLATSFPEEAMRAAAPSGESHETIDRLRAELAKPTPSRAALEGHVGRLRSVRELEAIVANWWDSPPVQRIIADLTQIGL
jgi:uncharacterized small protein (DUF1192 family)